VDRLRRCTRAGLIGTIITAGVTATMETLRESRERDGPFSRGFWGFNRYLCELVIHFLANQLSKEVRQIG
jgi:hypothetical protein